MKKISLQGLKEVLSEKELKEVMAGSGDHYMCCWTGTSNCSECVWSWSGASCTAGADLRSC